MRRKPNSPAPDDSNAPEPATALRFPAPGSNEVTRRQRVGHTSDFEQLGQFGPLDDVVAVHVKVAEIEVVEIVVVDVV